MKLVFKAKPQKRRAIELYHANSPFRAKVVQSKKAYRRGKKHKKQVDTDPNL
jgi:hypothetical protein